MRGFAPGELDVVVVCNGCTDQTAELARSCGYQVRVVELASASKPAALRIGDAAALAFPRLYLDADVILPGRPRPVMERFHRRARRPTADQVRQRGLVSAGAWLLPRPLARAGGARVALGRRRLRAVGGRPEAVRDLPGHRRRRPLGRPPFRLRRGGDRRMPARGRGGAATQPRSGQGPAPHVLRQGGAASSPDSASRSPETAAFALRPRPTRSRWAPRPRSTWRRTPSPGAGSQSRSARPPATGGAG